MDKVLVRRENMVNRGDTVTARCRDPLMDTLWEQVHGQKKKMQGTFRFELEQDVDILRLL